MAGDGPPLLQHRVDEARGSDRRGEATRELLAAIAWSDRGGGGEFQPLDGTRPGHIVCLIEPAAATRPRNVKKHREVTMSRGTNPSDGCSREQRPSPQDQGRWATRQPSGGAKTETISRSLTRLADNPQAYINGNPMRAEGSRKKSSSGGSACPPAGRTIFSGWMASVDSESSSFRSGFARFGRIQRGSLLGRRRLTIFILTARLFADSRNSCHHSWMHPSPLFVPDLSYTEGFAGYSIQCIACQLPVKCRRMSTA